MYLSTSVLSSLPYFLLLVKGKAIKDTPKLNSLENNSQQLCPNSILNYPIADIIDSQCLQDNFEYLQNCVLSNFNETSQLCSFCVIVNPSTFEDESNCECVKCVIDTLSNNHCLQNICSGKQTISLQDAIKDSTHSTKNNYNVITDDIKENIFDKYENTLKQNNQLQYLTDDYSGTTFRNFLPFEQKKLIRHLLNSWIDTGKKLGRNSNKDDNKDNNKVYEDVEDDVDENDNKDSLNLEDLKNNLLDENLENEAMINKKNNHNTQLYFPGWLKMGNKNPKKNTKIKGKNNAITDTQCKVKTELISVLIPTTTTKTLILTKGLITETETKHEIVTKTDHVIKYKPKTLTETKLEKTIEWKTDVKTKQNTEYVEKWKTKTEAKFRIVTLTATDIKLSTKFKYKYATITVTDTMIVESSKTITVPKTIVTSTTTETKLSEKIITVTTTTTGVSTLTEKTKKHIVTATKFLTKTKVITKRKCKVTKTKTSIKKITKTFTIEKNGATKKKRIGRMLFQTDKSTTLNKRDFTTESSSCVNLTTSLISPTSFNNKTFTLISIVTPQVTELEIIKNSGASRTLPFEKSFAKTAITISVSSFLLISLALLIPEMNNKHLVNLTKGKNANITTANKKKETNLRNAHFDEIIVNLGVD